MEAAVFSVLSGFTIGAFTWRERALTRANEALHYEHRVQVVGLEEHIQYYYEDALVCLACFDAESALIEKVSPGFLQLLRIPADVQVRGRSIADLLHVASSTIERIVCEARTNQSGSTMNALEPLDAQGKQLKVRITAKCLTGTSLVEFAFFVVPSKGDEEAEEAEIARKDLERFQQGMYRREIRILELKEEVNEALERVGKEPRYKFDLKSQDTVFPLNETKESEDGE
ncbi:MAG: hypothetical protein ACPGSB_02555 [Opitutales bacterium]